MKKIFYIFLVIISGATFAVEKTITIEAHVNKITMGKNNNYRLELKEFAAVYHASPELLPCLQNAIKENKKVSMEVEAYSLKIKSCK